MARSVRDAPPAHYIFKIQSFSLLSQISMEKYESNVFESGGYKWKLVLYPKGNEKMNVKDHISVYLEIAEMDSLKSGWEVNATFKLFLYDQIRDKYLTIEDNGGLVRRFHVAKTEWGISHFTPLTTFNDPANGYLVNDTCVFGAEVFVRNSTGQGGCLSLISGATTAKYTWKIENFSTLKDEFLISKLFAAGKHRCKIQYYPKGNLSAMNQFASIFLMFDDLATAPHDKAYAKFTLRVTDQKYDTHVEFTAHHWFTTDSWGWPQFIELSVLNDPSKGYIVKDTLIIVAEVTVLASVKSFK